MPELGSGSTRLDEASSDAPAEQTQDDVPATHELSDEDKAALYDPNSFPTVHELVCKLLDPPMNSFNNQPMVIYVSMEWVLKQVDGRHFITDHVNGKRLFNKKSKIFTHGRQAGLPETYFTWLCEHQLEMRPGDPTVPSKFEYFPLRADFCRLRIT
ncbi:hypothetical protein BDV96DRAFT_649115 [Lophiotrema nucula]|uniref:Uncharacterized protein n=1 Tax=Lophiotrema nucula TaxID=690887 RepID=A0A6A5YZL0_9PLEO|nr:hypothetical protein BDV96DRAFT_649115 [Lophiotrema nucula]